MKVELTRPQIKATAWCLLVQFATLSEDELQDAFGSARAVLAARKAKCILSAAISSTNKSETKKKEIKS